MNATRDSEVLRGADSEIVSVSNISVVYSNAEKLNGKRLVRTEWEQCRSPKLSEDMKLRLHLQLGE